MFNIKILAIRREAIPVRSRALSIKYNRDFFKRVSLCFGVDEVYHDKLDGDPRNKDDIELPRDILEANRKRVGWE